MKRIGFPLEVGRVYLTGEGSLRTVFGIVPGHADVEEGRYVWTLSGEWFDRETGRAARMAEPSWRDIVEATDERVPMRCSRCLSTWDTAGARCPAPECRRLHKPRPEVAP